MLFDLGVYSISCPNKPLIVKLWSHDSSFVAAALLPEYVTATSIISPSHSYRLSLQKMSGVVSRSDNFTGPLKREIQSTVTAADSCDGEISFKPLLVVVKVC